MSKNQFLSYNTFKMVIEHKTNQNKPVGVWGLGFGVWGLGFVEGVGLFLVMLRFNCQSF